MAGDAAASSYTAKRLTTLKEPHLEKGKQRDRETQPHSSRSQIRCSRELLENEELHGPDQITLQNK